MGYSRWQEDNTQEEGGIGDVSDELKHGLLVVRMRKRECDKVVRRSQSSLRLLSFVWGEASFVPVYTLGKLSMRGSSMNTSVAHEATPASYSYHTRTYFACCHHRCTGTILWTDRLSFRHTSPPGAGVGRFFVGVGFSGYLNSNLFIRVVRLALLYSPVYGTCCTVGS